MDNLTPKHVLAADIAQGLLDSFWDASLTDRQTDALNDAIEYLQAADTPVGYSSEQVRVRVVGSGEAWQAIFIIGDKRYELKQEASRKHAEHTARILKDSLASLSAQGEGPEATSDAYAQLRNRDQGETDALAETADRYLAAAPTTGGGVEAAETNLECPNCKGDGGWCPLCNPFPASAPAEAPVTNSVDSSLLEKDANQNPEDAGSPSNPENQ